MSSSRSPQSVFAFGARGSSETAGARNEYDLLTDIELSEPLFTRKVVAGSLGATKLGALTSAASS